ncbi:MAG: Uma2 family endonuclease [Blastocatellales bacterium]
MGLPKLKEYWTVEEYLEFEKTSPVRHEYVDGEIYAMAGESKNHNRIAFDLSSIINQHLSSDRCEVFIENVKVKVSPSLYYYPDVVVTCVPDTVIENEDDYVIDDPVLIVEVLSKSTARTDRTEKLREYKNLPNLREYVIVSQFNVQVEVYRRQNAGEDWTKQIYRDLQSRIHFDSIGAEVSVADIYRRVKFSENILEVGREDK